MRDLSMAERSLAEQRQRPVREVLRGVLDVTEPLPEIRVDAARLQVALTNLITNAVEYSDPSKHERWVEIGAEEGEGSTFVLEIPPRLTSSQRRPGEV